MIGGYTNMNAKEKIEIIDVKKEVEEIKNYLYDNKQTGQDGLIHRVEDLDEKVDEILWEIRWAKKLVIIVSTFVGGAVSLVSRYLFN